MMAKVRRIATAGPLTIETIYPAPRPRESYAARQGRYHVTSQAMQLFNIRYAYQRLELQLAANIRPGDWKVVLTYRPERLPKSRDAAKKDFAAFIRRYRNARKEEFCYFYRLEHKHKAGNQYHFHIYMTAGRETAAEVAAIWGNGQVYLDKIVIDADNTYEQLAKYIVKETPDKLGQHLYDHSHHIKKPDYERVFVPDDSQLIPPNGSMVLYDTGRVDTMYGSRRTIKYMSF